MGAWAALSSSTIAKSGNVTDTWNITSALPTDNWTAMGDATPTGVTALGSYTAYYRTQNITLSNEGALFITFLYSTGNHQLEILGVDLLNSNDEVVRSDYHYGKTGTLLSHNVYMLDHIASGDYKIRFIINSGVSNSVGNITVKHLNIKTANSYENITNWYFVRMHSSYTNKNMYYDSNSANGIAFGSSQYNNAHYLWGFVKDTDGIRIYNKAAGSSVALDNANPCTLSADGTSLAFTFGTGNAGNYGAGATAYFSLYMNPDRSATARSYLNYRTNGTIQRYGTDDQGSAWMIYEQTFDAPFVAASEGKVYTIKAHFSSTEEYFTNNGTNLDFSTSATNGVKDYWILRSSGNGDYPWRFESGRGDGMFLSNNSDTEGLTSTGVYLQINTYDSYFDLRGSNSGDAKTTGIVNLGTWSSASGNKGFGEYGVNCWSGSGHWCDASWTTSYAIEEVQDVDIYTVISNINAGGVTYSEYTGKKDQTNGGFYILGSAPSAGDFTPIEVADYTAGSITVDASAKTITVNYTANITYTLTDINGATYSWSASGSMGTVPTLTGCDGYTLSNEVWNEEARTYTADITFPFPVSSNDVTNWTYIGQFHNKGAINGRTSKDFLWHAESSGVIVHNYDAPTNESGINEKYKWAIYPSISAGAITFKIKNSSSGYISTTYTGADSGGHAVGNVTHTAEASAATPVIYYNYTGSNYAFKTTTTSRYLSVNSVNGDENQVLGVYSGTHDGISVGFYTPADFTTLMTNLKTARTLFINHQLAWSQGKYTEQVEGTMTTTNTQLETDRNVVKDTPTAYFTASQFETYTDNYKNAVAGLRYVMPSFFRVKNLDGSKYAKVYWQQYSDVVQLVLAAGGTDASSIFFLNASNNIISYYSGSYLFSINHTKPVSYGDNYLCTYEFLPGSDVNRVYVHVASNPSGWGGSETYWIATDTQIGRGTAPTADSDFLIEEVTSLPITMNQASDNAYYATINLPVAVEIPSGLSAYSATADGTTLSLTKVVENGVLAASQPVILYSKTPVTSLTISGASAESADSNELLGTTAAASVTARENYVLGANEGVVGFYLYDHNVMPGFKAYLPASAKSSGVKAFTFSFEDVEDAIRAIESENSNLEIYDIAGRRVQKAQKGLYIVNGKKVMYN